MTTPKEHKGITNGGKYENWKQSMVTRECGSFCSLSRQLHWSDNRWYNTPAQLVLTGSLSKALLPRTQIAVVHAAST